MYGIVQMVVVMKCLSVAVCFLESDDEMKKPLWWYSINRSRKPFSCEHGDCVDGPIFGICSDSSACDLVSKIFPAVQGTINAQFSVHLVV